MGVIFNHESSCCCSGDISNKCKNDDKNSKSIVYSIDNNINNNPVIHINKSFKQSQEENNNSDQVEIKHMEETESKEKHQNKENEKKENLDVYNQLMYYIDKIIKIQRCYRCYYYKKIAKEEKQKNTLFQLNEESESKDSYNYLTELANDPKLKRPNTLGINKYLQMQKNNNENNKNNSKDNLINNNKRLSYEEYGITKNGNKGKINEDEMLEQTKGKQFVSKKTMGNLPRKSPLNSPEKENGCSKYIVKNIISNNQSEMFARIFTNSLEDTDQNNFTCSNYENTKDEYIRGYFLKKNNKKIKFNGKFDEKSKKKDGYGQVLWTDKSKIEGIFSFNHLNGYCKFYNGVSNSIFSGEYLNNIPNGFGIYENKTLTIQGYWEKDNMNGIGIEVWDDGTYYQGEFINSKKNGIGLYRWPDGTIYQGEFVNNQMSGTGVILYSDDRIYSGQILNGYMNGYGIFIWGNGNKYMGYYLQDTKHGFGIFIWGYKPFIAYFGFWEMGKQHGVGAKVNGNNIQYCLWNRGKISITLKGLYEIDRYLSSLQMRYYKFFLPNYINKIKSIN